MSLNSPFASKIKLLNFLVTKRVAILAFCIFNLSCSVNILQEFATTDSDEALLFSAKQLINRGDYTGALTKFADMSTTFAAQRDVISLHASAYLGLCSDLDFVDLVTAIGSMGATRFMPWLMNTFRNGTANKATNCEAAETLMKSIASDAASRTSDENFLMIFISFAKMGAILSLWGDSGTPDGTVDGGRDPCNAGQLSSANAKELATGLNIAVDSLGHIGSSTLGSSVTTTAATVCAALPPGYLSLCSTPAQVDTTSISASEESGMRSIVNESQDVGLGTCTGDASVCACP